MSTPVHQVMTAPVITVGPDTPVADAMRLLTEKRISGVPVIDAGRVVGMVSEADLLWRDGTLHVPVYLTLLDAMIPIGGTHLEDELRKAAGATAKDVMSHPPICIVPDADVTVAASRMLEHKINRLPVVDGNGHLVGIVARTDLLRAMQSQGA
jgi:CBS domain-containing protein